MPNFTAGTSFTDGVTNDVTALKLNALIADAVPTSSLSLNSTTGTIGLFSSGTGTAATPAIQPTGDTNTGIFFPAADTIAFAEGGAEAMRIDSSGNVGIGTTSPNSRLSITTSAATIASFDSTATDGGYITFSRSAVAKGYIGISSPLIANTFNNDLGIRSDANLILATGGNTERLRIDSSGNVGIGAASPIYLLDVYNSSNGGKSIGIQNPNTGTGAFAGVDANSDAVGLSARAYGSTFNTFTHAGIALAGAAEIWADTISGSGPQALLIGIKTAKPLIFATNDTERLRIDSSGNLLVGKTSADQTVVGAWININGKGIFTSNADAPLTLNRLTDDGLLVEFFQASTLEGTISVSGNTVSYNPFAGSHWSQLEDGSRPEILRGTVLESINQLCQWPDGGNERFAKCKISDTVASKKVYGVFLDWDNSWDQTNDLYVTAVGLFVCRINASVTVQIGDLLESNGDGTARVQADDVIRSSTIGKVTSSIKTHEHPDGSYCVPTVLYCG